MMDIVCKECGKIFVCLAFHWIRGKRVTCTKCDEICAECYTKKIHARLELVREMNDTCYPDSKTFPYKTVNPTRREN